MIQTTPKTQASTQVAPPQQGDVLLQIGNHRWLYFNDPIDIHVACCLDQVIPTMAHAEAAIHSGHFIAGYVAYEAAPAFDDALVTHPCSDPPLCWFGVFSEPHEIDLPAVEVADFTLPWHTTKTLYDYRKDIEQIKHYIEQGDTYQVNYTIRLETEMPNDPFALFLQLVRSQPDALGAYVHTEDSILCSLSPELFYRRNGSHIVCQPMKGTSPRGVTYSDDQHIRQKLRSSGKNRAENIMVVDMIRNDLGRIARLGSVQVDRLFELHKFPTLFQMTSTISAKTDVCLTDTFRALFPCASITGAPKVRTMQIICELEETPRGLYTGAIGYASPNGEQQFNVAIRTIEMNTKRKTATFGTGSGIIWDSHADKEYIECFTKTLVVREPTPDFRLLETLRWEPDSGYFFLHHHLRRANQSALYFDIPLDIDRLRQQLNRHVEILQPTVAQRVRVLIDTGGQLEIQFHALNSSQFVTSPDEANASNRTVQVGLTTKPVDSRDRFLYHKTTHRMIYDTAAAAAPDLDDIILFNEKGHVTETTVANLVIKRGVSWITPPVSSGLLAGTYRAHLLEKKTVSENVVHVDEIRRGAWLYRINSVRGWDRLEICESAT